jgi:hypothetical protein
MAVVVTKYEVCKVPTSADKNGRKYKHITFVLEFNYSLLTLDSPGKRIHTWVKKRYQIELNYIPLNQNIGQ